MSTTNKNIPEDLVYKKILTSNQCGNSKLNNWNKMVNYTDF